ncbi:hypothetical protein N7451_002992 [Penicillium sp. IBT 35674x]|nr:hypothetical protein N7451_002992 [Penicillium sp. IBT 35674x]
MVTQDQFQEAKSRLDLAKYLKQEIHLSYHYMRSNVDTAFLPFFIFPMASLLHREANLFETLRSLACNKACKIFETPGMLSSLIDAIIYGFLYAYTVDLANSAEGDSLEDAINKPDRPLVSGKTSIAATKARYYVLTGIWVIYSYILNVHIWTLLWITIVISSYMLHTAKFGPTKDLSMGLGVVAQLMACWELGGSNIEFGWAWAKIIATWVLFTAPIQDFRDVPGDKACGRQTTPMLLGDLPARIYTSCNLVFFGVSCL